MSSFNEAASIVMQRCDELAAISQSDYVDRRYLTTQHRCANDLVEKWLRDANCITWQDSAGNLWGRYESPVENAQRVILGSHLDTVPNGGKYDGMLGVLAPLAIIQFFSDTHQTFPFHIDIVGFGDEEGTRFGTTLLGSRALTGNWSKEWAELKDSDGVTLEKALSQFGLSFVGVELAKLKDTDDILGYLEVHIEQGPVLEQMALPVGIVTAINGARRFEFEVEGFAGHAGTVPMATRQDALTASAEMILAVEKLAKKYEVVATVGSISNRPNGVNVISGKTVFSVDIRSSNDARRDAAFDHISNEIGKIAKRRNVAVSHKQTHDASAVNCNAKLQAILGEAVKTAGVRPYYLASGAGHDAMEIAKIAKMAMLFVRCHKGISHHPAESITQHDVEVTLNVLHQFVMLLSKTHSTSAEALIA